MADELTLSGRAAIVTGAGNGLGRAESLALARAGALLVLNDLPGDAIHETAELVRAAGGQAVVVDGDIGDWETGRRLVGAALDAYGRLDILVNNAGVLRDRMIFSMSADEWDLVLRVHLRGHFVTTRFATEHWRGGQQAGGQGPVYGRIVNTLRPRRSCSARRASPTTPPPRPASPPSPSRPRAAAPGTASAPTPSARAPAPPWWPA